jgi:hypothetical protein
LCVNRSTPCMRLSSIFGYKTAIHYCILGYKKLWRCTIYGCRESCLLALLTIYHCSAVQTWRDLRVRSWMCI